MLVSDCATNDRLYADQDKWLLEDGHKRKPSTNGTWYLARSNWLRLFVDEFFLIHDGMTFKAGQSLFRAALSSSSTRESTKNFE